MTELRTRTFGRILLIKPSSPGDILHALPVLHALRRRYPDAHLAWLVATAFSDLVAVDPALDEVIPFDRKHYGKMGRHGGASVDFVKFVRELRARRFDLVIDLQGLFRSGFLAWASRAPVRLGFAQARELGWMFYTHRIDVPQRDAHAADRNRALVEVLGLDGERLDFTVALLPEDRAAGDKLLRAAGIAQGQDYAVLVPATRWETKCWSPARLGGVARRLRDEAGLKCILVGGRDDEALAQTAVEASNGAAISLCGQTTLRQLAALIERAAVVVTADSTPMHMAVAFGRPLVALFGPTNPTRTGPYGRLNDVLRVDLECSPCYLRKLSECPHAHACMDRLTEADVANAALSRIARPLHA